MSQLQHYRKLYSTNEFRSFEGYTNLTKKSLKAIADEAFRGIRILGINKSEKGIARVTSLGGLRVTRITSFNGYKSILTTARG